MRVDQLSAEHIFQLDRWGEHGRCIEFMVDMLSHWETEEIINWNSPRKPRELLMEAFHINADKLEEARRISVEDAQEQARKHLMPGCDSSE